MSEQLTSMILPIIAALPVILICLYVYQKDRNKEPIKLLLKLFSLGIITCFIVVYSSEIISDFIPFFHKKIDNMNLFELVIYSFIGVAFIEEFCKWIMTYLVGYNNKEFDEVYDIIIYSVFVSLGLAFFENLLYVLGEGSIKLGISRALLAVPGHACDAIFMGYYLSIAKLYSLKNNKKSEKINLIKSIVIPTLLHGIYDFCIFSSYLIFLYLFFVFIIILYIKAIKKLKEVSNIKMKLPSNITCSCCDSKVDE